MSSKYAVLVFFLLFRPPFARLCGRRVESRLTARAGFRGRNARRPDVTALRARGFFHSFILLLMPVEIYAKITLDFALQSNKRPVYKGFRGFTDESEYGKIVTLGRGRHLDPARRHQSA